ncbi:MAG: lipid-A-disaccharide synthase [Methylococcaceae bacterium]|nr:lipid-A-disaccharide synthase [Methylococcaceae bacterium]MDZ4155188.1 lipid-A-disaccharide synthase [Methylococcales bacterium]MDP2394368.1 lipid-A-disaccharide synthase [Methylococcaceae bacterium]MDP3021411.1 lipid-A-disaccharide synthase [Methylococcaceae bacterium]MDP3388615.1 lipid-A-disaccharide synthase [Methylococcaceae bacterium]
MVDHTPLTVMFSAGESSGEQHAANMFLELKKLCSDIKGIGMGGAKMAQAGIDIRYDSANIAVIGVIEVLKHYGEIRRALTAMKQLLAEQRPDLLVCVDYKEFNFKLAKYAKSIGIKVLFYVSPQVWAWRPGRVKAYGEVIDMMAVIFPFETAFYDAENVPVRYVGHPSVDKVRPLHTKAEDLLSYKLNQNNPVVGLLPGSRANEIKRMLPVMLAAAEQLQVSFPGIQFVLPQADSISDALLQTYLKSSNINVTVVKNQPYDVIQCCDAVMTTSGTATLEISLLTVPMVIVYKLAPITYWLGRWLVNIPFIGLPNIVAGKAIVKELIQHEATPKNLAVEVQRILSDVQYAAQMRENLSQVKQLLGQGGGSKNMAELALEMLQQG